MSFVSNQGRKILQMLYYVDIYVNIIINYVLLLVRVKMLKSLCIYFCYKNLLLRVQKTNIDTEASTNKLT